MKAVLSLLLAPIPSIIWLAFYLRKDTHPEPNRLVVKIFIFGALMVPLAGFFEFLFSLGLGKISILNKIVFAIIGFALIEEVLKYLVVRFGILKNPHFDEPVDAMIYMIISALGFAAAENIYLLSIIYPAATAASISEFITTRFLGATFLHALASGIIGYFLAASLFTKPGLRKLFIGGGIIAATILHSVFNYIIILSSSEIKIFNELTRNLYILILLLTASIIVSSMFKKVSRYRSIHKV